MQSLNIAKNRSSFTPYVSQSTDSRISRTDTETSLSYSSMSKHAPVKILPNSSRASSTVPLHSSSSPPPIKPSQSSATLTSTGKFEYREIRALGQNIIENIIFRFSIAYCTYTKFNCRSTIIFLKICIITILASSSFCPRPTPPCHGPVISPRTSRSRDKRRPRSRARNATPDNDLSSNKTKQVCLTISELW